MTTITARMILNPSVGPEQDREALSRISARFVEQCTAFGVKPTLRQIRKAKQGFGRWKGHYMTVLLRSMDEPAKAA